MSLTLTLRGLLGVDVGAAVVGALTLRETRLLWPVQGNNDGRDALLLRFDGVALWGLKSGGMWRQAPRRRIGSSFSRGPPH